MAVVRTDQNERIVAKRRILADRIEEHPELRVAITEGTAQWVPSFLQLLDQRASSHRGSSKLGDYTSHLSMKPSEYFARNIRVGASIPRPEVMMRHQIGVASLMWGSDYPHPEGTWPNTAARLADSFVGVPEDEIAAILGGNAVEFYGFDSEKLVSIAAAVGPEKSAFTDCSPRPLSTLALEGLLGL